MEISRIASLRNGAAFLNEIHRNLVHRYGAKRGGLVGKRDLLLERVRTSKQSCKENSRLSIS